MRRREIIAALGVAAWPLAASAQQPTLPMIGFLHSASPAGYAEFVTAFQQGLAEVGFAEGRNVAVEYRWQMVLMIDCLPSRPNWPGCSLR